MKPNEFCPECGSEFQKCEEIITSEGRFGILNFLFGSLRRKAYCGFSYCQKCGVIEAHNPECIHFPVKWESLQRDIFEEINLGSPPEHFEGSSSCYFYRCEAVRVLKGVLKSHSRLKSRHTRTAPPNNELLDTLMMVAKHCEQDTSMQKTRAAISDVILVHIRAAELPKEKRSAEFKSAREYLRDNY